MAAVRCGNKVHKDRFYELEGQAHYHDTVAQVRLCYSREDGLYSHEEEAQAEAREWESESERQAELACERFYEEGPNGGYYAGSEEEARDRFYDSLQGL